MTPENIEAILRTIRLGLHPERAAAAHGVTASTMRKHRQRDPEFATAIKEAEAMAEQGFLSRILKHTEKQWTAAAWMLERRWPERWRKRENEETISKADLQQAFRAAAAEINQAGGA
jgi:transposase